MVNNNKRNKGRVFKEVKHLLNDKITSREVRIVGDHVENGVYSIYDALKKSKDLDLDLIQISDNSGITICRIENYNKFLYDTEKVKKKQKTPPLKEIKLSPNIGDNDLEYRSKHAIEFLKDGSKIKVTLDFRGREITHKENAQITILKFISKVEGFGVAESLPKLDGKKMIVFIKPSVK